MTPAFRWLGSIAISSAPRRRPDGLTKPLTFPGNSLLCAYERSPRFGPSNNLLNSRVMARAGAPGGGEGRGWPALR